MSKYDMYIESKDKVTLSKQDKENYAYAERRHKANSDIAIFLKLPYYLGYKLPRAIFTLATRNTKAAKKENARLKRVMASKERARKSNVLKELEFIEAFKVIGFKDKLGNYPVLQNIEVSGDKETIIFKSNISLSDWISSKEDIETVLNTNIFNIKQGNDKQLVYLETTKKDIETFINWNNDYLKDDLIINLGRTALEDVVIDLEHYTSGIISGSIGSGKSVTLMGILIQLLLKQQLKRIPVDLYIFDGKGGLDLGDFEEYSKFTIDIEEFKDILDKIFRIYEERKILFKEKKVKKLSEYNKKYDKKIADIFIVIDEISVITDTSGMMKEDKEIRQSMTRILSDLARLGRALGIHLLIGIQVPNFQTMPGQLKNVLDMRISGFLKDKSASEIILGNAMASKLNHIKGRMILDTLEYQSYYFDTDILQNIKPVHTIDTSIINDTKTIDLSKKRKQAIKRDSKDNVIADIDLSNK